MAEENKKEERTVSQFLEAVASGSATPGGGSVAALAGSLGAALVEMVANLTVGKKAFAEHEEAMKRVHEEAHAHRKALVDAVAQDVAAYEAVMEAYLLPKKTEDEKRRRKEEIQKALKKAADPPLFTAATSLKVMKLCQEAVARGNPNAISDAAVGALLSHAALGGGVFNVLINLSALEDKHYAATMKRELRRLEQEAEEIREQVLVKVREKIN